MDNDRFVAMLPDVINGKTQAELRTLATERDKYIRAHFYNGVKFAWTIPRSSLDALQTFQDRDDDVLIITYPKSGTHWINEIMAFILNDGRDDFPRSEVTLLEGTIVGNPDDVESSPPGYKIFEAMDFRRCMNTHLPLSCLPKQLLKPNVKAIYLARNPKDVLVSFIEFARPFMQPIFTRIDTAIWHHLSGEMVHGSWFDHVLDYWKLKDNDNFMFIKYEDLHKDLRGNVCKLANYVGKNLSDDVIDSIVERVTFKGMQKTYNRLEEELGEEGKLITHVFGGQTPYLRKGQVGGWKDKFTVEQSALYDKIYNEKLKGTGLEFDFEL